MSWSDRAYAHIAELVRARTGLSFSESRIFDAEAGIERARARAGAATIEELASRLALGTYPLERVVEHLVVHESYFFRDRSHLELVRAEVRRPGRGAPFRVWSAGCAAGEEAYSVAILLEEEGAGADAQVLATDVSEAALDRARTATYRRWALRGLAEVEIARWFRAEGRRFRLHPRLLRRVRFERLNLLLDRFPAEPVDVILCRNVLMYLDPSAVARVASRFFEVLAPGGLLICGPSDPVLAGAAPFEPEVTPDGLVYRRPANAPPPLVASPPSAPQPPARLPEPLVPPPARTPADAVRRVQALASRDPLAAEDACDAALAEHNLAPELHYVRALLHVGRAEDAPALESLRRAIYLDRSLAVAHFACGRVHERRGELEAAARAYGRARRLAASMPPAASLPLGEGDTAGALAREAALAIARIEGAE